MAWQHTPQKPAGVRGDWWSYYHLSNEPNLSLEPLVEENDRRFFWNRDEDLRSLQSACVSDYTCTSVITGVAGSGKTSLLSMFFAGTPGFIRVDVRQAVPLTTLADILLLKTLEASRGTLPPNFIENVLGRYKTLRTDKEAQQYAAGGGAVPAEARRETGHETAQKETPFRLRELLAGVMREMARKQRKVVILLDECCTHREIVADPSSILSLICQVNDCLPKDRTLILTARPSVIAEGWKRADSQVRQMFASRHEVGPLFVPGEARSLGLLVQRFGVTEQAIARALAEDALLLIEHLSGGNVREYLRFVREALIDGWKKRLGRPLGARACYEAIQSHHVELKLEPRQRRILRSLQYGPKQADVDLVNKTRTVNRSDLELELRVLCERNLVQEVPGSESRERLYRLTQLGERVLPHEPED